MLKLFYLSVRFMTDIQIIPFLLPIGKRLTYFTIANYSIIFLKVTLIVIGTQIQQLIKKSVS